MSTMVFSPTSALPLFCIIAKPSDKISAKGRFWSALAIPIKAEPYKGPEAPPTLLKSCIATILNKS
ncbi:Dihydroxyacetone kinase [Streptococcus parauberis KRS-02083]|uniref:Dihydroxyacetone kinase n=1 Tax=Streptococcus parauberis KRS-02083 TaxID=1207545 RepID=A0ABN0IUC9_9STRE|nr:Dihydroxyacetone kinase [Streptococcus parauberis KRS-02083]